MILLPLNPKAKLIVEDYDPQWAIWFGKLSKVLLARLEPLCLGIEHVGSTSVPGLAAKPIIDMDVVIASEDMLGDVSARLAQLGYAYEGELGVQGRHAYSRTNEYTPDDGRGQPWIDHHLYVCSRQSPELRRHLLLREYLRANPAACNEYAALKRKLAARDPFDREKYVEGKGPLIERLLTEAAQTVSIPHY